MDRIINPEKKVIIKTNVVNPCKFIIPKCHFKNVEIPITKEKVEKKKPRKLIALKGNKETLIIV